VGSFLSGLSQGLWNQGAKEAIALTLFLEVGFGSHIFGHEISQNQHLI